MSQAQTPIASSVVAVYPDHPAAERTVRQLYEAGFAIGDISIVGRDFQETDRPYGFVSRSDYAEAGLETGAWFGGLFGFFIGAGFLIFPGLGFVVVAGPIAAAFLAGIEGGLTGTALCGLAGALIGWNVPKDRALKYETEVKGGKFLVFVRLNPEAVARARNLLDTRGPEHIDVYEPPASKGIEENNGPPPSTAQN